MGEQHGKPKLPVLSQIGIGFSGIMIGGIIAIYSVLLFAWAFPTDKEMIPVAFVVSALAGGLIGIGIMRTLLIEQTDDEDRHGLSKFDNDGDENLVSCEKCGRIVARTTKTCPKCMNKLTKENPLRENAG